MWVTTNSWKMSIQLDSFEYHLSYADANKQKTKLYSDASDSKRVAKLGLK